MAQQPVRSWLKANPGWSAAAVAVLVVAVFFLNSRSGLISNPQYAWAATAVLIVVAIALIGASVNGRPVGVLIDNRNRVSLSKFQAAAWTVMVLSMVITAVAVNLANHATDCLLNIVIPGDLLIAMGISATSLVGTPVVLSFKSDEPASRNDVERTATKLNLTTSDVRPAGKVFGRATPDLASWADMFRGDETSNAGDADLSKVQQFLITLLLIGIYSADAWTRLAGGKAMLPPLSEKFLWLMGISHASYLAYKAAPHGGTASQTGAADPAFEAVG